MIIKSGANALSRADDDTDCMLDAGVYGRLWQSFDVDRFATGGSAQADLERGGQLPYWTLCVDGVAQGVDGVTAHWGGQRNYASPPVKMVGQVAELVLEQQVSAVVIAAKWEAHGWRPLLVQGASMVVVLLPRLTGDHLFAQVQSNCRFHPLGRYAHALEATKWVAAYFRAKLRQAAALVMWLGEVTCCNKHQVFPERQMQLSHKPCTHRAVVKAWLSLGCVLHCTNPAGFDACVM